MSDEPLKPPSRHFVIYTDDEPPSPWRPTLHDMWNFNKLTSKSFQPYVAAIGQASLAWNDLQESIADLFSAIAGIELAGDSGMLLAIWHSLDSDRTQRKLLTAANNRIFAFGKITEQMHKDVKWLLAEADRLSDARNDVVHSPLLFLTNAGDKTNLARVGSYFHPRAKKLSKKDILPERYVVAEIELSRYAPSVAPRKRVWFFETNHGPIDRNRQITRGKVNG